MPLGAPLVTRLHQELPQEDRGLAAARRTGVLREERGKCRNRRVTAPRASKGDCVPKYRVLPERVLALAGGAFELSLGAGQLTAIERFPPFREGGLTGIDGARSAGR